MPPVSERVSEIKPLLESLIRDHKVIVFSKSTCPYCTKVKELFQSQGIEHHTVELDKEAGGSHMQAALLDISGQRTVPNVYVNGKHLGGWDDTMKAHKEDRLLPMINTAVEYEYDLVVIGGGSGGLAASKEAASLGKKVAVLDYVKPTPVGTSWGLGGTCVNVGCIPKKLMHQAALLGHHLEDARKFGWDYDQQVKHNWNTMRDAIQDYIGSLNWGYRVQLRDKNVTYINAFGSFVGPHKVNTVNRRGKEKEVTAETFLLAMGERPRYPDIEGATEYGITSDDLFSLAYNPGKTLVVGASYVALECAGFLASLGMDVTVMVRSIFLRGFDQQMADKIGDYMAAHNVKFIRKTVPTKVEKIEDGAPGKYKVTWKTSSDDGSQSTGHGEYNTVMFAIGRDSCTKGIGLEEVGVKLSKSGKVISDREQTSVPWIYGIGDILDGKPELTPVAIQAGRLLARRIYGGSNVQCDYTNVPTTVFTPLEYGCIGLSEESATEKFGEENIEVFHNNFWPLEWTVAKREENACYGKIICLPNENNRVVGFHICGPNAGEITQGFAVAMKLGATKDDLDATIGIHPTCAELFTQLEVSKSSGAEIESGGC